MEQKPELQKEFRECQQPHPCGALQSLRGHKAPPLDKTGGRRETAETCGGSNVSLNPSGIAAGGISWRCSSSEILSALRFLMGSEASAAGKECHLE